MLMQVCNFYSFGWCNFWYNDDDVGEIDPDEDYPDQKFKDQASSKRRNNLAIKNAKYESFWA